MAEINVELCTAEIKLELSMAEIKVEPNTAEINKLVCMCTSGLLSHLPSHT